jgi:histidine ammonia-lyase
VVRALLTARAAGLAVGGSGVSPAAAEALVALLAEAPPVVPSLGSVGMSDLTVVAHAVAPLLDRVALRGKDGLALISGNALATGRGALVVHDARVLLGWVDAAAALALEAFAGNLAPLDPRAQAARPAAGQAAAAARLRALLDGSTLAGAGVARLQDPVSFRCLAPVHGAASAALEAAAAAVETELNGAGDNPLVLADDDEVLHVGNFHAAGLTLAFDALGLALHGVASLAAGRVAHLLDARASGLPRGLTPLGADRAGLFPLAKTVAGLVATTRQLAAPTTLEATALSEGVEDHGSFAPLAVDRVADLLDRLRYVAACELVVAAQGHDLRGGGPERRLGEGTARAYATVRALVPALEDDRPLGPEVEALAARLREP